MKKYISIITMLLLITVNIFAVSTVILLQDFKQKTDLNKRIRAVRGLCKKQYVPVLDDLVNFITIQDNKLGLELSHIQGLRAAIAKNLRYYAGVPYNKIKKQISLLIAYLGKTSNIDIADDLILSLAIILNKNGTDQHKKFLNSKIQNLLKKIRRISRSNSDFRTREEKFVRWVLYSLKIMRHDSTVDTLGMMLQMNYSRRIDRQIRKLINSYRDR